jgi:hypothetical protein
MNPRLREMASILNSRNTHSWCKQNPRATVVTHFQQRFSVNVWAGLINGYLIGPFIFNTTVNSKIYLQFLVNELPLLLEDLDLQTRHSMLFQQDGAPCHCSNDVKMFLDQRYPGKWVGRGGPVDWPPRSPDLTPMDFFLWGELKRMVYQNKPKPTSEAELKRRIEQAVETLKQKTGVLQKATDAVKTRAQLCLQANGSHF